MNATELENAFKAAMAAPGGVLAKLTSMDKTLEKCCPGGAPPTAPTTDPGDTEGTPPDTATTEAETPTMPKEEVEKQKGLASSLAQAFKDGVAKMDEFATKMEEMEKSIYEFTEAADDFYDPVQKVFGGLQDGLGNITNETSKSVASNLAFVQDLFVQVGGDLDGLSADLKTKLPDGTEVNIMDRLYKTDQEARRESLQMLDEFSEKYQARYNEMSKTEVVHMQAYTKGLGLSTDKVAKIVQRQIQLTGQAGTESLEKISAYSKQVAAVTGVSYKQIAAGVAELITNVQTFGNIQEEEAARIAGTLQQLGMSYQSFGSMVNKFMSFDQAASAIGDLTSVFGVHMDAMEMMQLANEDEEEFMLRMRDSFIDQGIAVEDLTKAQRNMLSSTLGIDASEVENFFDPDLMEVSAEEMEAATEEADLGAAFQDMIDNAEFSRKSLKDLQDQANAKIFSKLRDQTFEMSLAFDGMKRAGAGKVIAAAGDAAGYTTKAFAKMAAGVKLMSGDTTVVIDTFSKSTDQKLQDLAVKVKAGEMSSAEAVMTAYATSYESVDAIVAERAEKNLANTVNLVGKHLDTSAVGVEGKVLDEIDQQYSSMESQAHARGEAAAENYRLGYSESIGTESVEIEANVQASSDMEKRTDAIFTAQNESREIQQSQADTLNQNLESVATAVTSAVEAERERPQEIFLNVNATADGEKIFGVLKRFRSQNGQVFAVDNVDE